MQTAAPRRLVLVRHATAGHEAASDHDRPLTPRGEAEARAAGEWLASEHVAADHALVSSAVRTRATWDLLAGAAGWTVAPTLDEALYAGGTDAALVALRTVPPGAATVALVGHNPTVASLALMLDDGTGDAEVITRAARGFPPATVAVLALEGPWSALDLGGASLVALRPPERG